MNLKIITGFLLVTLLLSQTASAFLPLQGNNIIIQQTTGATTGKQGTYNQTLANNVLINKNGYKINFINGTNNPINVVNDSSRQQVNVTISSSGAGSGVSSLNSLTGALTIACVSGNTTCTTSGGNTITINTAWNIVTTGLSAQTITKQLTLNNLILGGDANVGSNALTNSGHKSTLPTNTGTLLQTNGSGTSLTGITYSVTGAGSTTVSPTTGNVVVTGRTYQNNTGTNLTPGLALYTSNSGSALQFRGIVCGASMTCSINATSLRINSTATGTVTSVSGAGNNVTSTGGTTPVVNLGTNAVITGGSAQTFSKNLDFGGTSTIDDFFGNLALTIRNPTNTFAITDTVGAITKNITATKGLPTSNVQYSFQPIYNSTSPGNKTRTTSATYVMLGAFATLTPRYSGNASVTVSGYWLNSVVNDGCRAKIQTSTSSLGANGAVVTGTTLGSHFDYTSSPASANATFSKTVIITGMTPGTKNFFDLAFSRVTGGTCAIFNPDWYIREQ